MRQLIDFCPFVDEFPFVKHYIWREMSPRAVMNPVVQYHIFQLFTYSVE